MNCDYCQEIEKGENSIYSDGDTVVLINSQPFLEGEILVLPKTHYIILEQIPDELLGKLWIISNRLSAILFEKLKAEGTNIFIQNGLAAGQVKNHFCIRLIPRKRDDGLNLTWNTKTLSDEEMGQIENLIKKELAAPSEVELKPPEKIEKKEEELAKEEEYLIKALERIP